ncbi:MAG: helix-hairpin-helix domain-containing protein [Cytophagaceae bacterium]
MKNPRPVIWKKLNHSVKVFFGLSNTESRGFVVVICITVFLLSISILISLLPAYFPSYHADVKITMLSSTDIKGGKIYPESESLTYKIIDPNFATQSELESAGFPPIIAGRIIAYRTKGGKFFTKEDLKKIYGIKEDLYLKIESRIEIKSFGKIKTKGFESKSIDINDVDSAELTKLKGIGPVLAGRIIKFRNKLGGFTAGRQLLEVYGLDTNNAISLLKQVFVADDFKPERISINESDYKTLVAHPYISPHQASQIIKIRKTKESVTEELLISSGVFSALEMSKLLPYLSF